MVKIKYDTPTKAICHAGGGMVKGTSEPSHSDFEKVKVKSSKCRHAT